MTSSEFRADQLFMRNEFPSNGKYEFPLIRKQELHCDDKIRLISCSDTRSKDSHKKRACGVHFFANDNKFTSAYSFPIKTLRKYSQYAFLLSPDFSTYADMKLWRQIESVAHNRWCGAFWQKHGMIVIPTISWSTSRSFEFCFEGVESNATVAVGMIGCKQSRRNFMKGYDAMLERLSPQTIICLGNPYKEMRGNLIVADYVTSRTGGNC